jgi:hypothetical protein
MGVRFSLVGAAIAAVALLAGSVHVPQGTVPEPPADGGTAVLQIKEWESLVGPSEHAALPEVTIMGGGRVIVPDGQDGALQRAVEYTLAPELYRKAYRLAHQAGLARSRHLPTPVEATDGSLLVVTLRSGGRTHTTTVTTPSSSDVGARGRIVRFRHVLSRLIAPPTTTRYRPAGYVALVAGGFGTQESRTMARPWPERTDLAAGVRTYIGTCTLLADVPPGVTGTAQWISGDHILWVTLRPLLPHERTCTDFIDRPPQ